MGNGHHRKVQRQSAEPGVSQNPPPRRAEKELRHGYIRELPAQFTGDPDVVNFLQEHKSR